MELFDAKIDAFRKSGTLVTIEDIECFKLQRGKVKYMHDQQEVIDEADRKRKALQNQEKIVEKGKETSKIEKVVKGHLEIKKVEENLTKDVTPLTRKDRRKAEKTEKKKLAKSTQ